MQDLLLPLFPLQVVLLPGSLLPLHIFEDRYKEMISEVMRERAEFGIVQAGEKGIVNMGCTAIIEKVLRQYPDGRLDILILGKRRFELLSLNDEKQYLRGAIEFFDDEEFDPVPQEVSTQIGDWASELQALEDEEAATNTPTSAPLSFRIGRYVKDLDFKQMLLGTRSEAARLRALTAYLPAYIDRQRQVAHLRAVTPRNGHSKHPPKLDME